VGGATFAAVSALSGFSKADAAILALLDRLKQLDYAFVTPTPETHRRVVTRKPGMRAADLRDIFGWSLPFARATLPDDLFQLLDAAGMLRETEDGLRSKIRVSTLDGRLLVHSAWPTDRSDSVFLGPDTYRFARFIQQELAACRPARTLVDIGTGSGAGAIVAASHWPFARVILTDINPLALRFAQINARHNRLAVELIEGRGLESVDDEPDLVIANPPFIIDPTKRAYRDGGDHHGTALSLEWALTTARRLAPRGRMLLYTGSAIVGGHDRLCAELRSQLPVLGCRLDYVEIDPDIFGEQLDEPGYEDVERIAAIGAVITRDA